MLLAGVCVVGLEPRSFLGGCAVHFCTLRRVLGARLTLFLIVFIFFFPVLEGKKKKNNKMKMSR
jgi:hypothetical protein